MIKGYILKLIFFVYHLIDVGSVKFDCGKNDIIYLNEGMVAYFESRNYPAPLTQKQSAACNLTFEFPDENNTANYHLIISRTIKYFDSSLTQINQKQSFDFAQRPVFSMRNYLKNDSINDSNEPNNLFAHEGYVVFADVNKTVGCAFNNDGQIITLPDELSIYHLLHLANVNINLSSDSCIWRFNASKEYGFKIVILGLSDTQDTELFIRNSTDIFVNKRSAKISFPHYNEDNYMEIELSNNQDTFFSAYLTVVKKTISKEACFTTKNATTITWHIETLLFPLNVICHFELIIPASTEYIVTIQPFIIETNVDYIRYTDKHNNTEMIKIKPKEPTIIKLFNYNNGSNSRYSFEYLNDGSIPSLGTVVTFDKLICQCAPAIIPCYLNLFGKTGIMNVNDSRYCGNLRCNFTITPCFDNINIPADDAITLLTFRMDSVTPETIGYQDDSIRTYSNGSQTAEIYLNYFNSTTTDFNLYFDLSTSNILEVLTYPTKLFPSIMIFTQVKKKLSVVTKIELSTMNPFLVIDVGLYKANESRATIIKVVVSKDIINPSVILFSNSAHGTELLNVEQFWTLHNSFSCFGDENKYSCKLNTNEIDILCQPVTLSNPILTIQLLGHHQKRCVLNNNIYIVKENPTFSIVAVATSDDDCVITVLINLSSDYHYYVSKLWTTSLTENVQVFAGTETLLFEFNSHTAEKWTSISLYSNLYTIKIPKKASVYIQLKKYDVFAPIPVINVFGPSYSLFHTASYGTSKGTTTEQDQVMYCAYGHDLKFTTIYYNAPYFLIYYTETNYFPLLKTGDIFVLKHLVCIRLVYVPHNFHDVGEGVVFLIETIEPKKIKTNIHVP